MKIVIIEDERLAAEKLQQQIEEVIPGVEIFEILESVEEAINWFVANPTPDLIFMDIQLDDGISFEIFNEVNVEAPVIFTTAYDKYAIRAFKVNSVDYLLKPIEKKALRASIEKFNKIHSENKSFEDKVTKVIEQISRRYKSRFFIKIGTRFHSVPVSQICCFYVEERSTFLQTMNGKRYDIDPSLDQLQKMVNPESFFRVNRNFLVNINAIQEVFSYSTNRLKLKMNVESSEDIIVSRDRVAEFKGWMDK